MNEIEFMDSTARDGIQSLWAIRLTAPELLAIAPVMDEAGFKVIDYAGLTNWRYDARFLHEDAWERLRLVCQAITKTPLNMWIRSRGLTDFGSAPKPRALAKLWMKRWFHYGIRRITFLEEENDYGNIPELVEYAKAEGVETVAPLMYSLSPFHTDEYYAQKARDAIDAGVDVIEIKDQGGLLTPERTRTFVSAIKESVNGEVDLPVSNPLHDRIGAFMHPGGDQAGHQNRSQLSPSIGRRHFQPKYSEYHTECRIPWIYLESEDGGASCHFRSFLLYCQERGTAYRRAPGVRCFSI